MKFMTCLSLLLVTLSAYADNVTRFIVLDVGEGQSLLIQKNDQAMMIDTGHAGEITSILNRLQKYGIKTINSLVLSHLHPDHASGYFRLRESFDKLKIYHNCQPISRNAVPDMVRWVSDALQINNNVSCVQAGDVIRFYDIDVSVLWPVRLENNSLNYNSLVLDVKFQGASILVMGDAGYAAEQYLLEGELINKPINILVAGHHGASDASSETFISRLQPEFSVVSVNQSNIRGYPSEEVINRLNKYSHTLLRTDEQGDLVFMLNEVGKMIYQN